MIVKEEFLNKLRYYFGLNLYEVKIWTALLSRGVSTAGELSDIGNVPRSRAYDVLESLEKKGFVVLKLGKPIKYIAVEPNEVVTRSKKLVTLKAKDKIKKLEGLKGSGLLKELNLLFKQGIEYIEPSDMSGAIRGRHNIYAHLEVMVRNAQKSITLMTTSKGLLRKMETLKADLERLNKKGVKIRIAAPINSDSAKIIKNFSKFAEIKNSDKMDARFCIVDDKDIMFMIMNDDEVHPSYDIGVWIRTPYFATALSSLFEVSWNKFSGVEKIGE